MKLHALAIRLMELHQQYGDLNVTIDIGNVKYPTGNYLPSLFLRQSIMDKAYEHSLVSNGNVCLARLDISEPQVAYVQAATMTANL